MSVAVVDQPLLMSSLPIRIDDIILQAVDSGSLSSIVAEFPTIATILPASPSDFDVGMAMDTATSRFLHPQPIHLTLLKLHHLPPRKLVQYRSIWSNLNLWRREPPVSSSKTSHRSLCPNKCWVLRHYQGERTEWETTKQGKGGAKKTKKQQGEENHSQESQKSWGEGRKGQREEFKTKWQSKGTTTDEEASIEEEKPLRWVRSKK